MKKGVVRGLAAALLALALTAPGAMAGDNRAVDLPVLDITTASGTLPGDASEGGLLRLWLPGDEDCALQTPVEIRLRGNTSRRFPKQGYRLKLVDDRGEKRKLSLCGLRADDDWMLNPMYADTSKLREALSYWLWAQINRCGRAASSASTAWAELWLNGEYRGLYGVQERVDRKQVDADRRAGILYKVSANDAPSVEALKEAGDAMACGGFELAFAGLAVIRPWLPAADYMALLTGGEGPGIARLSETNAVDYTLWCMLTQARDNHFKNMYIHCAPEGGGYTLYRIPWDLNYTLGDQWDGDSAATNHVRYAVGAPALDDVARLRLTAGDAGFMAALGDRWAELRAGAITEERLLNRARGLFETLYPAILRDTERWPACGMGEGSAANIRDIEDYFRRMLANMDRWMTDGIPLGDGR